MSASQESMEPIVTPYPILPLFHLVSDVLAHYGYTMTDELAFLLTTDMELFFAMQRLCFAALVPACASQSQRINAEM